MYYRKLRPLLSQLLAPQVFLPLLRSEIVYLLQESWWSTSTQFFFLGGSTIPSGKDPEDRLICSKCVLVARKEIALSLFVPEFVSLLGDIFQYSQANIHFFQKVTVIAFLSRLKITKFLLSSYLHSHSRGMRPTTYVSCPPEYAEEEEEDETPAAAQ